LTPSASLHCSCVDDYAGSFMLLYLVPLTWCAVASLRMASHVSEGWDVRASAGHSDEVEYEGFHKVWKGVDRHLSRLLRTQQHADDLADTPHGLHTAASGGCWQPPEGLMPAAGGWGAGAAGGAWTETVPGAFAAALAAFASSARDTVGHAVLRVEERWRGMQQLGSEGGAQVGDGNGPRIHMEQFPMQYEAPVLDDPYAR
jgi:hypothetical protein